MADKRKPLILTLEPVEPLPLEASAIVPEAAPPAPAAGRVARPAASQRADTPPPRTAVPRRREAKAAPARTPAAKPSAPAAARPRPERPARAQRPPRAPREAGPLLARWAYPAAAVAALLWAGCLVTFAVGYERGAAAFEFAPVRWAVTALLALLPAFLMLTFGYMVRQSARLAEEARRTRTTADAMSGPATLAGAHARGAVEAMREEIARAQAAADEAARRMAALGEALAEETRRVSEAAVQAERAASRLGGRLQSERAELASLSGALDAQLVSASEGAARHARLAAEASDLAQANLHEAQAALAARTADLVSAAGEAARASETAGSELARGGDRLERLAAELKREQAQWAAVARALLSDQDDVSARLETERARFTDAAAEARGAGEALAAATAGGTETLQRLAGEAASAGEVARRRMEGLAEAAFDAGQRADQAFDARLAAARRALDAQATLVEEAGLRSAARIEAGLAAVEAATARAAKARAPSPSADPPPRPPPTAADAPEARVAAAPEQLDHSAQDPPDRSTGRAPAAIIVPIPPVPRAAASDPPPLRPRLQLAPLDEDLFAAATPDARPPPPAEGEGDDWSWKDLLTAIDDPQPLDDDALAERMIGEIEAMGVDPGALLPRARIDEIARAVDAGDNGRAREAVRRLAPAAVRRLSRRVLTDKVLRGQADLYRRRYGDLVRDEQRRHGGDGNGAVSALLGSDPGRAFLLLDAAVGDLH